MIARRTLILSGEQSTAIMIEIMNLRSIWPFEYLGAILV